MIRTRTWVIAGVVLIGALAAGTLLAQGTTTTSGAASGQQPQPRIYNLVAPDALGIASSAEQLRGAFVKLPDSFYDGVTAFPDDAVRAGFTPQNYYAFRTRPDGSNLICFIPRMVQVMGSGTPAENPELKAFLAARPVRGAEVFIMGKVGPRMFVGEGGATAFAVHHIFLGHEEPKLLGTSEKKPVVLTVERFGQAGNVVKQEFTIEKPGQRYLIHDPADPQNATKDIYITLQF